jgi:hypothetical protein
MLTEKDYCDYETSTALYELGYDCQVIHLIAEKITLYEAQKWLREVKGIHITINYIRLEEEDIFMYTLRYIGQALREGGVLYNNQQYSSYEEALSEGINESVKILKDSRKQALESENTEYDYGHNVYHEEL